MYKNKNWVCFPQVSAPLSVPGQAAARSSPDRTSSPVTIARTQAKSASTVRCVTSASWGATTWRNTPGDIQAFIPACSRAPARPREGVAPCPCPPLILETEAPPGCETHPHTVHVHTKVHTAHTECGACTFSTNPVEPDNQPDHNSEFTTHVNEVNMTNLTVITLELLLSFPEVIVIY